MAPTVCPTSGSGTRSSLGPGLGAGVGVPAGVGVVGDPLPPHAAAAATAAAPLVTTNSRLLGKDPPLPASDPLDRPGPPELKGILPHRPLPPDLGPRSVSVFGERSGALPWPREAGFTPRARMDEASCAA